MGYGPSFLLTWLTMTALYLGAYFTLVESWEPLVWGLGLFVPYGIWNTLFLGNIFEGNFMPLVGLVAFVALLFTADRMARALKIDGDIPKILFNLALLFAITLIVDFSIHGEWPSMALFLGQTHLQ